MFPLLRATFSTVGKAISLKDGRIVLFDPQADGKWQVMLGTTPIGITDNPDSVHQSFQPDPAFVTSLHQFMATQCCRSEPLKSRAQILKTGWMNIRDERVPEVFNRCPEAEDILGVVRVEAGKMIEGSYEPMPSHRLWSPNGLFRLPHDLSQMFDQ